MNEQMKTSLIILVLLSNFINAQPASVDLDSLMFGFRNKFWSEKEYLFVKGRLCNNYEERLNKLYEDWDKDSIFIVKYEDQLDSNDLSKHLCFFGPIKSYKYLDKYLPPALTLTENGFKFGPYEFKDSMDAISLISSNWRRHFELGNSFKGTESLWMTFQDISQYIIMQDYAITHHGFLKNDVFDQQNNFDVWALRNEQLLNKQTEYYNFYYDPSVFTAKQNIDSLFNLEDQKFKEVITILKLDYPDIKIDCFLYKDLEQKYYLSATPGNGNPFVFAYQNHSIGFASVEHETIHILFDNQVGSYSSFTSEGIVGYYYSSKDTTEWKKTRMIITNQPYFSIKEYLSEMYRFNFSQVDYAAAAFFSKFLIDTYGLDKYKSFFEGNNFEEALLKTYGKTIVQISAECKDYFDKNKILFGPDRKIVVKVISNSIPDSSEIFITGDHQLLRYWNPSAVALEKQNDSCWTKQFNFPEGTILNYKITCGSWDKEALDENGNVPQNSVYEVKGNDEIIIKIDKWKDQTEIKH